MALGEPLYKSEYIKMAPENKVSGQSVLWGSQNIVLSGKTIVMNDCIIRGDLTNVRVGHRCGVKSECPKATIQAIQQRLHFFLYILGTTSLLRKIVWSTQLILALMFTLARIVWLSADVSWKAVEKFLTTQYYPQKLWSHHSLSSQAAQDFSQGIFQNVLRSWWLTSPRATTNSFCPWHRSNVSALCLEFDWTLRWTWGQSEPDSIYKELLCLWHLPHSFFVVVVDFPGGSDGKVSVYNAGDPGSIPGLGRYPGEGNGNPL